MLWQPEGGLGACSALLTTHPPAWSNPEARLLTPSHSGITSSQHLCFLDGHCLLHQQVASGGSLHLRPMTSPHPIGGRCQEWAVSGTRLCVFPAVRGLRL